MESKKQECPSCAVQVDADAEICPICGYEFPKQSLSITIMAWLMILLLIWWLIF
jgi:RNA polymerase subunit RPABC4/transcription elongation factor Spt4